MLCRRTKVLLAILGQLHSNFFIETSVRGNQRRLCGKSFKGKSSVVRNSHVGQKTPACVSFDAFSQELRKLFGLERGGPDASCLLMGMRQGGCPVAVLDFCTCARESNWNLASLCEAFLFNLADYIKEKLLSHDSPPTLDGLIELATRIDLCIWTRRQEGGWGSLRHFMPIRPPEGLTSTNWVRSSSPSCADAGGPLPTMGRGATKTNGTPAVSVLWSERSFSLHVPFKRQRLSPEIVVSSISNSAFCISSLFV